MVDFVLLYNANSRYIPKQLQKLKFFQSQHYRFNLLEAAPIQLDRGDAEEVKGGDVGEGKTKFWNCLGIHLPVVSVRSRSGALL